MSSVTPSFAWTLTLREKELDCLRQRHSLCNSPGNSLTIITAYNHLKTNPDPDNITIIELSSDYTISSTVAGKQQEFLVDFSEARIRRLAQASPGIFRWRGKSVFEKTFIKLMIQIEIIRAAELLWLQEWLAESGDMPEHLLILSPHLTREDIVSLGITSVSVTRITLWRYLKKCLSFAKALSAEFLKMEKLNVPEAAQGSVLYPFPPIDAPEGNKITCDLLLKVAEEYKVVVAIQRGKPEIAKKIEAIVCEKRVPCFRYEGGGGIGLVVEALKWLGRNLFAAWKEPDIFFRLLPLLPQTLAEARWHDEVLRQTGARVVIQGILGNPFDPMRTAIGRKFGARRVLVTGGWIESERAHTRHFELDRATVWGEYHRNMLVKLGMPVQSISITGRICNYKDISETQALTSKLAPVQKNKKRIVFFSQIFNHPLYHPPRTSEDVLRPLCEWAASRPEVELIIKSHPSQPVEELLPFASIGDNITILKEQIDCRALANTADILGTFFSTAVVETLDFGIPIFLLNFSKAKNFLPLPEMSAAVEIDSAEKVPEIMDKILSDEAFRKELSLAAKQAWREIIGPCNANNKIARVICDEVRNCSPLAENP